MCIDERSIWIVIFGFKLDQITFVAPIETFDMQLNIFDHFFPVMRLIHIRIPSTFLLINSSFGEKSGIMHHLFGNASNIDTSSSDAPCCSDRSWLHIISDSNFCTSFACMSSSWNSTWTSSNYKQIIIVLIWLRLLIYLHNLL